MPLIDFVWRRIEFTYTLSSYFGSYGYRSVAIFRVHAAERQAIDTVDSWKDLR